MHEYSIVNSLIASCEEHLKANDAAKVTKVVVKIGVMSGVEPHLLKEAFDMFKQDSVCHEADLVLNIQKVVAECRSCKAKEELAKNEYVCPKCGSYELDVLDGEDMYLMSLEME